MDKRFAIFDMDGTLVDSMRYWDRLSPEYLISRGINEDTDELMERCRKAGVEFTPGTFFGAEAGNGFLRVNLACQHARVKLAVEQLKKAIME